MKCHYEVLGLDSNCTADDLKKAYRKLALEWHPDKNLHRLEESKENFQLIQQAYEVLSDPQERAWYDRHKDDILRGGAEEVYKDDCLDVYQYFNTSCFKGYNDDEKGFYTVYRHVFEKITAEDKPFMDDDEDMEVPQFGYSDSSYEEVVHNFYAYWQSYCTAKSFSWVDKFDLTEARRSGAGRQVIRAMEKENKKMRDQHKKLRNEEVRELVAFVRKRDKRIQAHKKRMEEVRAEKAKKAEELRKKQLQERNKAFESYEETEWSSMSQFENHFNEIESNLDATFGGCNSADLNENDEMDELGDLYCVACEKDFRSQKAFKNHENSKKHKENVAVLKELMEADEAMANFETVEEDDINETEISPDGEQEESISSEALLDELIKSSTKSKKKKKKNKNTCSNVEDAELAEVEFKMENTHICEENVSVEDLDTVTSETVQGEVSSVPNEKEDVCLNTSQSNNCINTQECLNINDETESKEAADKVPKLGSKSESTKKKAKKDKISKNEKSVPESNNEDTTEKPITLCGTCNNNFPSRNKLFEHLKQTGHAVYKNGAETSTKGSGKKQRKKKL